MNRADLEEISGEEITGISGLWAVVLMSILQDIESPSSRSEYQSAKRIILQWEGCFNLMAEALAIDPGELQRRIVRYMKSKRCEF